MTRARYERLIGRVYFAVDPLLPANRAIADLLLAPRNGAGLVEFSSALLVVRLKDARRANGTVFFEIVNRGRDQSLGLMSGARSPSASPEAWDLGDRFVVDQGFTMAFLGWQFDVAPGQGLGLQAPSAPVQRAGSGECRGGGNGAADPRLRSVRIARSRAAVREPQLTFRSRIDAPAAVVPRNAWRFGPNGCSVQVETGLEPGLYEAVYEAKGSPVAGLGLAAVRDFASYLKHGASGAALRDQPAALQRVLGFGYSQSGRFLREFVRDGFNADEHGRQVFDAMMIAVGRRRRRQLQSSVRDAGSGGQLRPVDSAAGRSAAVYGRRAVGEGAGRARDAEDLLHVFVHRGTGRAPAR